MSNKTCFVIMPFADKDNPNDNKWDDLFNNHIKPAVEEAELGFTCIRSFNPHGNFMRDIMHHLATAEVVIAVLSELRPNVMYELGVRNALRRKTIMLAEQGTDIPSDLSSYIALFYSTTTTLGREKLQQTIRTRLTGLSGEPTSDSPPSDYLWDKAQDICDEWHENKNPQDFFPRLKEVLPSYALKLELVLGKVSQHIRDLEERATKNAEAIAQQNLEEAPPQVQQEAEAVAREGETLQALEVKLTPPMLHNMAFAAYHQRDYEAAFMLGDQLTRLAPNAPSAWTICGGALIKLDRPEEALVRFDRAVQIVPSDANTWSNKGAALAKLERYHEALECLDQAVKLDPRNAGAWRNRGTALSNIGRLKEAVDSYDKGVEFDPTNAGIWRNRGIALGELGRHEEELESFKKSVQLDPEDIHSWSNLGVTLNILGKYNEALQSANRAIELDSNLEAAWGVRGQASFYLRDFKDAAASFKRAFESEPTNAKYINNVGFALEASMNLEEALKCYQQALEIDPKLAHAHYNRGSVLKKLGRLNEAVGSIERALQLDPEISEIIEEQKRAVADK